jgi:spermidine synthase
MTQKKLPEPAFSSPSRRFLSMLLLLFAGSGCAALIYEIVWFQWLQLVIGSSAVSLGVLLGTFMGGMCLGSIALPRLVSVRSHPLRVYALLEVGTGICALALLFGMPAVDRAYVGIVGVTGIAGHGLFAVILRAAVASICLLPPTVLMGATLPAIGRWVEATPQGVSWLGYFYGGNIAGAVFGCLVAGFYLLRVHDMATATYVAVAVNLAVAAFGFGLASGASHQHSGEQAAGKRAERAADAWPVYVVIGLSGASALAAEVIWTRLLSLMLGATVYTFSIILAVFLIGLGIGSSVGSYLARESRRPRLLLGWCQLLLAGAMAWTAYMLARSLPYWPVNPFLSKSPWFTFQLDLVRCLWAILPAACLWGASFPLALAGVAVRGQDPGRLIGGVYAANTIGAIVGAVGASIFLISWMGTQHVQRLLIGCSAAAAIFLLTPFWSSASEGPSARWLKGPLALLGGLLSLLAIVALGGLLAWTLDRVPWELIAHGRSLSTSGHDWRLLYVGEGMNSSVAVTESSNGWRNFHVSGKIEASSDPLDMRLQRMLGHLPALFHAKPQSVLIVGCGAGVTAGSFTVHPDIKRIVICEIEPLIPQVVSQFFARENYDVVHDPRVEIVYDDARHFVLTTQEKFDIITSDPIHPWVKGSATLYTKEYFEMCKRHLNPGGVITQWVPLYESNPDVVKSEFATFFHVFPHGTIWSNDKEGSGYDVVLLGQAEPTQIDVAALQERLERPDHQAVAQSLRDVEFGTVIGLLSTYAGQASDLKPWLQDAQINRDRNLRLQYLAGLGLNSDQSKPIYREMLKFRAYPSQLLIAPPHLTNALQMVIGGQSSGP